MNSKWISVIERMPTKHGDYICASWDTIEVSDQSGYVEETYLEANVRVANYDINKKTGSPQFYPGSYSQEAHNSVKYWQPFPKLPAEMEDDQ